MDDNYDKIHCTAKRNFQTKKASTTQFGLESIQRIGPIIWNFVPEEMKNTASLDTFKKQVKKLAFDEFPCKNCKKYIQVIG